MNRDMAKDSRGMPASITGAQELLQRILIRLTVRKGGFPPDPELGSRVPLLANCPPAQLDSLADSYVREALAGMEGVHVQKVEVLRQTQRDKLKLTVWASTSDVTIEVNTEI